MKVVKIKIYRLMMLLSMFFINTSFSYIHPIKLTSSLIEISPRTAQLKMECRVFIDDFLISINEISKRDIDLTKISNEDKKIIEKFFEKYYVITVDGEKFPLRYSESEVLLEHNVFILKFSQNVSSIKKGDQLCIENKLFFREFDFLQTNMVTVRIPSMVEEIYFEATSKNYALPIDL